jgi:hypothetical protein
MTLFGWPSLPLSWLHRDSTEIICTLANSMKCGYWIFGHPLAMDSRFRLSFAVNWGRTSNETPPWYQNCCVTVTLATRIWEAICSNLIRDYGYPDRSYPWYFSVSPHKYLGFTSITPRLLPSKSFPIHHSSVILQFDAMLFSYWKRSKITHKIKTVIHTRTKRWITCRAEGLCPPLARSFPHMYHPFPVRFNILSSICR